ncbi:hypothetical protein GEMRC1_003163 [Eukaryota sp. GEM-RC1]
MDRQFFLLLIFISLALAGCRSSRYSPMDRCHCWCQTQARENDLPSGATCSYVDGGVHKKYCGLCSPWLSGSELDELHFGADATFMTDEINLFPVTRSKCAGGCDRYVGYHGSQSDCMNWAKQYFEHFLPRTWNVRFVPRSFYNPRMSPGHCSVSGRMDPCSDPL